MAIDVITLGAARKYTDQTVIGLGALKGAAATIKDITHQDGINRVTFEWTGLDGTKVQQTMEVYDGTPIYVWESGNTYNYGDLVIYESAFYRCITENSDVIFDNTKYNEIGSPDGNYDIVADSSLLPNRFTAADRKMYYSIDDEAFWLWNGQEWILQFDKEILNTLQPKTMSEPITVDGTSQTTVEGALSAINTIAAGNKTNKQNKNLSSAITVDGTSQTTVEGALGAINTLATGNKTNIGTLSALKTTAKNDLVSAINELKGTVYTFHIDPDEADSYDAVTYHDDAVGMVPASMGATTFNYGSWENAFFMPKPCMLKFDGTVAYYLDPNDYTKKADGTASDISDLSFPGNAMMEFPLIWYKWVQGSNSGEGYFYVANYQVDGTYKCYSNLDCNGNVIEHFYMPIYNGVTYDGKLRSLSGKKMTSYTTAGYDSSATYSVGDTVNYEGKMYRCTTAVSSAEAFDSNKWAQVAFSGWTSGEEEIAQATANNTTSEMEWYIDQWCDRVLIQGLLVLISKSIDTQGKFGRGIDEGSDSAKENYVTGSLNNKGLFYGSTSNGSTAIKVFGMENYWALQWRRVAGLIGSTENGNNTYLYKMTASTADGTTVKGYNTTGSGYITASGRPSEHNWLKKMQFGQFGALPLEVGSYSTQYYKDHYWTGTGYALFGGSSYYGSSCGAFSLNLNFGVGRRSWDVGAAPSCKPCLIKEAIINE